MSNSIVIFIFLFLISAAPAFANDRGRPKTAREIADLSNRAVPVVCVTYELDGQKLETHGSGFFLNYLGEVVTNAHVVRKEADTWVLGPRPFWFDKHPVLGTDYKYEVKLPWVNKIFEARLLVLDKYKDLAKLQVIGINKKDYDVLP